jgi:hypothetical protein
MGQAYMCVAAPDDMGKGPSILCRIWNMHPSLPMFLNEMKQSTNSGKNLQHNHLENAIYVTAPRSFINPKSLCPAIAGGDAELVQWTDEVYKENARHVVLANGCHWSELMAWYERGRLSTLQLLEDQHAKVSNGNDGTAERLLTKVEALKKTIRDSGKWLCIFLDLGKNGNRLTDLVC